MGLVASSSGKHKGETKISHRGRKRLRYWLFQAEKSAVAHAEEFKELHVYYTTREKNPLKKMQSLIAIACKLLRIIFTILKKGIQAGKPGCIGSKREAVFQNPAEDQKLLKLSRVLEKNLLTQIHGRWIITKRLVERCRVSVRGKPHSAES